MVNELEYRILEYLQKNGATNTFKLAHTLEIKRDNLLKILRNLEERELVRITTGKVEFLSYPSEKRVKKKPEVSEKSKIEKLQEDKENQKLYIEKLKKEIKQLEQRPQKVITRTIIKEAKSEPIKKPKRRRKREKIKEVKIKPKKIKRGVKLRKKFKKVLGAKKSFKKLGLKIKGGLGIFKVKEFIKNLKRR